MLTAGGVLCCAYNDAGGAADTIAAAIAAALKYRAVLSLIRALLVFLLALLSQRPEANCDPARGLTRRTQPSAFPHIHAQSIVGRNGIGGMAVAAAMR
jgi:hypothetical protein